MPAVGSLLSFLFQFIHLSTPRKPYSFPRASFSHIAYLSNTRFFRASKKSRQPAVNSSIQPSPSGLLCCLHPCSARRTARARTSVSHSAALHGFLSSSPTLAQGCITCSVNVAILIAYSELIPLFGAFPPHIKFRESLKLRLLKSP